MSLTTGRGPLSRSPAGRLIEEADAAAYVEPFWRRVRAVERGRTVVDSQRVLLVHRQSAVPSYAFPAGDVGAGLGEPEPLLPGYVRVPWGAVESWFEEEEQVFVHPRNPYHRVDCFRSKRRLRVEVAGALVVDTQDTVALYETSLAPRLYVSKQHLLADVLTKSVTTTYCPYKGTATYWSARVGDIEVADVAFSYEDPYAESVAIRGHLSFLGGTDVSVDQELPEEVDWAPDGRPGDGSAR